MLKKIFIVTLVFLYVLTLPDNFSWGSQGTKNYLGPIYNQNNPHHCESGWAISTTNALSARINIAMDKMGFHSPSVSLSAQSLLECDNLDFGCLGGDPGQALRWILRNNITDSSCNSYKAKGHTNGLSCTSQSRCQACWAKGNCKGQANSKIYGIETMEAFGGEQSMATQIMSGGPIICGISATLQFKTYYKGIFEDTTGTYNHNHYIVIYGWGQEGSKKFWRVQNSYGPTWGEEGSIRIARGINTLGIESLCYAAKPANTWSKDIRNNTLPSSQQLTFSEQQGEPLPINTPLTSSHSQLTPNYCDASWAFAAVHALSDAELIRSKGKSVRSFSVQALLNCGVGTCEKGGNPHDALSFINKYGIPEQGCQHYQSMTPAKESCSAINNCANCQGNSIYKNNCTDVKNYKRWKIYNYGSIDGAAEMSRQLLNHHALICGIEATSAFKAYNGNSIFSQTTIAPKINHWVEVIGQGNEDGTNFWLGRNSWGTAWGMSGFFKIKKGGQNLGIQTRCYWAGDIS